MPLLSDLRVLRDARVVRERRSGRHRIYELNPAGLDALRTYFDRFWAQALESFARAVEQSHFSGRSAARDEGGGASGR